MSLNNKQKQAWEFLTDDQTTIVVYGGAAGGGKTYLTAYFTFKECLKAHLAGKRLIILVCSKTIKKLSTVYYAELFKITSAFSRQFKVKWQCRQTFGNQIQIGPLGSTIILKEVIWNPSDPDYDGLAGYNADHIIIDEAQDIPEKGFNTLLARLRGTGVSRNKLLITCNPRNCFLKTRFYDPFIEGTLPDDVKFVPATVYDNVDNVSTQYLGNFDKMDLVTRRRMLGDWDYQGSQTGLFDSHWLDNFFTGQSTGDSTAYMSIDIAGQGGDRTVWCVWKGLTIVEIYWLAATLNADIMRETERLASKWSVKPGHIVFDGDGMGNVIDLKRRHIAFSNASLKTDCYLKMSQCNPVIDKRVNLNQIINDQTLRDTISQELQKIRMQDTDRIISKRDIKALLGRSPDFADAIMMRFYFELNNPEAMKTSIIKRK